MAKGVSWIKLQTDIFDNDKIRMIELLPEHDTILVIWLKLLCLAGDKNEGGFVKFTDEIPFTDRMLAKLFDRPLSTVQLALKTFEAYKMIEIVDDFIFLRSWEKYQNADSLEKVKEQNRIRQKNFRERNKCISAQNRSDSIGEKMDTDINETTSEPSAADSCVSHETECTNTKERSFSVQKSDIGKISEDILDVFDIWNAIASEKGIEPIKMISRTQSRYRMLECRIREYGIEYVISAMERIRNSSFLCGQNKNSWIATFDWFVRPNNIVKVAEGNYDDRKTARSGKPSSLSESFLNIEV